MVGAVGDLPSIPRIYEALTNALMDPDVSLAKVAKIVEQDVGICAKILQLVNSAFFGISHSMTNIQNAVSYLGINTLRSLVLSVEIFRTFAPRAQIEGFSLEALHRHAQLTAQIVRRLPMPKHLVDIAMVAAMLHDVGKLILAWKLTDRLEKALVEAQASNIPLNQAEERLEGFGHAEIGACLLGLWGLPYTVVEAVALHHRPNRVPHQGFDAISAVYAANLLAHGVEEAADGSSSPYSLEKFQEEINELGIGEQMPEWQAMVKEMPAMAEA
jgi:HD-like signal output (HDOD) protein